MRAFVFAVVLVLNPAIGFCHEWYPAECCSSGDCYPIGKDENGEDLKEPDPVKIPGGYKLYDGIIIKDEDVRFSHDGNFHVCRQGGRVSGQIIIPTWGSSQKPCLFIPSGS